MKLKLIFIISFFYVPLIVAQVKNEKELSGSISLALSLRLTEGRTDYYNSKIGLGLIGSGEYFIPSAYRSKFGFRLFGGGQYIYGDESRRIPPLLRTDMYIAGGGIKYAYRIANSTYPFVFLGLSNLWFDPKSDEGKKAPNNQLNFYDKTSLSYDFGGGLHYIISDLFSVYGELQVHLLGTDYVDDIKSRTNDAYISAAFGISLTLNRNNDYDDDGVLNKEDPCPDESEDFDGFEDQDGCPDRDNDRDDVADVNDHCPNIAEDFDGFQDEDGCPDTDNDNDGIVDMQDKCPNKAEDFDGYEDQDGCIDEDNDNDGVADTADKCINAPEDKDKYQDEDGCPDPDNDKDGIFDVNDKCPNLPENINGYKDTDGCPDTLPKRTEKKPEETKTEEEMISLNTSQREFVISGKAVFQAENGAELKSSDIPELNRLVKMIQSDISSRWRIEVYMDSGPSDQMMNTSKERADAVLQYFVLKGLPSFQFQTFGMGSRNPVANNNTGEGREKNRRIVIRRFR